MAAERKAVESSEQLMSLIQLKDVVTVEYHAVREKNEDVDDEVEPRFELKPAFSDDGEELRVDVIAGIRTPDAKLDVIVAVLYELSEPIEPVSGNIMGELLGASTILTVAPYIREAMTSAATRIRVDAPLLPLVTPQRLQAPDDGDKEDAPSE